MAIFTTVIHTCDRCGKEQKEEPLWMGLPIIKIQKRTSRKLIFREIPLESGWRAMREIEICNDCLKTLQEWFNDGRKSKKC